MPLGRGGGVNSVGQEGGKNLSDRNWHSSLRGSVQNGIGSISATLSCPVYPLRNSGW